MIQGIPMKIIGEYAEATFENVPEHGIAQWLCEELLRCREQLKQGELSPKHLVSNPLPSKQEVWDSAVSFAEYNPSREYEDTKATFIGGVEWMRKQIKPNVC
tara:strand:- start:200 stop:505 length:306 start_codon:yes stop_codon:yes gene_type:complete